MEAWGRGVVLEDGYKTQPADVRYETGQGKGAWVRVIMGEGRKRQIREICKQLGLPIVRILRIRIGTLRIGTLKPRQWRFLNNDEINELKSSDAKKKEISRPIERKKISRRYGDLFFYLSFSLLALSDIPKFLDGISEHALDFIFFDAFDLEGQNLGAGISP